jgi:hypothetical protein
MEYKVHRFQIRMTKEQDKLEQFLNNLKGEVVAIIPNITPGPFLVPNVNFLLIVEKFA